MRYCGLLLAVALLGCAHSATKVQQEEDEHFTDYHHIGIPTFADSHGQGGLIADSLSKALQTQMLSDAVDRSSLEQILLKYRVGSDTDLGVEALEQIRARITVDAIIFGKMAPDWSGARVIMMDAKMGVPVFSALVKPRNGKKVFATPDDITQEILRAIATLQ